MNENGKLSQAFLTQAKQAYQNNPANIVANSVMLNGIDASARRQASVVSMQQVFSDEIETLDITNQKKSGRCWIFAGMNVLRYHMNRKLGFKNKNFELSQPYLMFYDKLEGELFPGKRHRDRGRA